MNKIKLAAVCAFLLSDGTHTDKLISLTSKNKVLIEHFKDNLASLFNLEESKFGGNWKTAKETELKIIRICSKAIITYLTKFSKIYRHSPKVNSSGKKIFPDCKIPEFILKSEKPEIKHEFLRVYVSCDGCADITILYITKEKRYEIRGNISIACEHPVIANQLRELLLSLGYSPIKEERRVRLSKIKDVIRFTDEIGFIKNCKVSSKKDSTHFYWVNKNDVAKLIKHTLKLGIPKNLAKLPKSNTSKKRIKKYLSDILTKIRRNEKPEQTKHKQKRNFLNEKEREWLLRYRPFWGEYTEIYGKQTKVNINTISKIFNKRFKKDIDPTTVFWNWKHRGI